MNDAGYAFSFKGVDTHCSDEYQKDALVYAFESGKSHHTYTVRIERYINGLHCVKFFDTTDSQSTGDFSHLSFTFEPRKIFRTIVDIVLEVLRENELASFLFIGASDGRDIKGTPTRRYRVYKLYLSDFDLREWFERADYERYSMYVLVNLKAMPASEERQLFRQQIEDFAGIISSVAE